MDASIRYVKVEATKGSLTQILTFHGSVLEVENFKDAVRVFFEKAGFKVFFKGYDESDGRAVEFAFYFQNSVTVQQALESGVWEPQIYGPLLN